MSSPHSATASCSVKRCLPNDDVAETFVGRAVFVGGRRGGAEPAFVNTAAVQTKSVKIIRMQLQPLAGLQKRARHPARREAQ